MVEMGGELYLESGVNVSILSASLWLIIVFMCVVIRSECRCDGLNRCCPFPFSCNKG